MRVTWSAHLVSLIWLLERYLVKRRSSEAPHYAVFCSLPPLCPLRSKYSPMHPVLLQSQSAFSLSVTDQVSHLYKTTGKIMVLYALNSKFLERRREDKDSELNGEKHSLNLTCS
jgi:hypothetical protein